MAAGIGLLCWNLLARLKLSFYHIQTSRRKSTGFRFLLCSRLCACYPFPQTSITFPISVKETTSNVSRSRPSLFRRSVASFLQAWFRDYLANPCPLIFLAIVNYRFTKLFSDTINSSHSPRFLPCFSSCLPSESKRSNLGSFHFISAAQSRCICRNVHPHLAHRRACQGYFST